MHVSVDSFAIEPLHRLKASECRPLQSVRPNHANDILLRSFTVQNLVEFHLNNMLRIDFVPRCLLRSCNEFKYITHGNWSLIDLHLHDQYHSLPGYFPHPSQPLLPYRRQILGSSSSSLFHEHQGALLKETFQHEHSLEG